MEIKFIRPEKCSHEEPAVTAVLTEPQFSIKLQATGKTPEEAFTMLRDNQIKHIVDRFRSIDEEEVLAQKVLIQSTTEL